MFNSIKGFNEAGAKSAGKLMHVLDRRDIKPPASMRPAQKAPENRTSGWPRWPARSSFNEAGAKSAGKRGHSALHDTNYYGLQ